MPAFTGFSTIGFVMNESIATITLNRPEARNALNGAMCEELLRAATQLAADETVRVVLVKGAGPVFCAGADLKERQGMTQAQVRERRLKGFAAYGALEALPMPAIAVVHGAVLGSGVEIAAACDFIVATPDAAFGTPEAIRGTVGATQRLPRVIGKRLAKDLMFTGRRLSAEEARAAGFVSRIFHATDLEKGLAEIAKTILAASPAALRLAKRCIDRGVELDPQGALELELAAIDEQLASGTWLGKP
jgi:enoyl-CoA hydratase